MPVERDDKSSDNSGLTVLGQNGSTSNGSTLILEVVERDLDREFSRVIHDSKSKDRITQAALRVFTRHEFHSGPIPSAAQFKAYENTLPGSADRILSMAEREQRYRHVYDERSLNLEYRYSTTGLIFGFLLAAGSLLAAYTLAQSGHAELAAAFIAAPIFGIVVHFINGRRRQTETSADHPAETAEPRQPQKRNQRRPSN